MSVIQLLCKSNQLNTLLNEKEFISEPMFGFEESITFSTKLNMNADKAGVSHICEGKFKIKLVDNIHIALAIGRFFDQTAPTAYYFIYTNNEDGSQHILHRFSSKGVEVLSRSIANHFCESMAKYCETSVIDSFIDETKDAYRYASTLWTKESQYINVGSASESGLNTDVCRVVDEFHILEQMEKAKSKFLLDPNSFPGHNEFDSTVFHKYLLAECLVSDLGVREFNFDDNEFVEKSYIS